MSNLDASGLSRNTHQPLIPFDGAEPTGIDKPSILTAIPAGPRWRMKALASNGDVELLPAVFSNRLEALGACILLAGQCGGEVRP